MQKKAYELYASVKKEEALPESDVCVVINSLSINNGYEYQSWFNVLDLCCNDIIYENRLVGSSSSIEEAENSLMNKIDKEIENNNKPPKEVIIDGVKYVRAD